MSKNPLCFLPSFPQSLKSAVNKEQFKVLNYFEHYPLYNFKSSLSLPTPYSVIYLNQTHFNYGTVRIRKPGFYVLTEDIVFEPNKRNNFFPTANQVKSGLYPMGKDGAYHLGFFAAITIEADNVILDLNGKTIQQSKLHNLQQRFYANIELASAPFIPKQGPASFGDTVVSPTNVMIMGGTLGLSSHHGIHGNGMKNVVLQNLTIKDMEVAAIALNGAINSVLCDINVENVSTNINILSTYSQGVFIKSFLTSLQRRNKDAMLQISAGTSKNIGQVISELDAELETTKRYVMSRDAPPRNIFGNPSQLYDGNVYGIVLNILGVVVDAFITQRAHNASGNKNIYMHNIHINNIISQPVEIVAINSAPEDDTAYSGKRMVGPVGDVFEITKVTDNNKYEENSLSNAQLILAKYNDPPNGTTNIEAPIVEWVEHRRNLTTIMAEHGYYYVGAGDSMGHTMKGNIGLFISCGLDFVLSKIRIDGVETKGRSVGTSTEITKQDKQGAAAIGIMITGTANVEMCDVEIKNVSSDNGKAENIKILSSKNIVQK
jgi:hypothetical protein